MIVFLVGASGATGMCVLNQLLSRGYQVSALVRTPENHKFPDDENLTIIKGDALQINSYLQHLSHVDAVISTLGTGISRKPTTIYSEGGRNIITAMRQAGIKKLIVLTAAAFDTSNPEADTFLVRSIVRPLFKYVYTDMKILEQLLEESLDLDWTCIRPTRLTSQKGTHQYRINVNYNPKGGRKISRMDLARFIVDQIESNQFVHKKPVIAY